VYLHIGGDMVVPKRELIAVIDLVANESAPATKEFLELAASEGRLRSTKKTGEKKTCIITEKEIYLSSISAGTITRRLRGC
jgi:regulator of extracellular matrix RemA (YlzA/DUF370 family)